MNLIQIPICLQSVIGKRVQRKAVHLLMKARTITFDAVLPLMYNATMLYTEVQGQTTVAYIGSDNGQVQKVSSCMQLEPGKCKQVLAWDLVVKLQ